MSGFSRAGSVIVEDGELTDPELRRLIHEIVRERMRVAADAHLGEYWAARRRHEAKGGNMPFAEYDPSELHGLRGILTLEATQEVLAFRELDLTQAP